MYFFTTSVLTCPVVATKYVGVHKERKFFKVWKFFSSVLESIESMIETNQRFEVYQEEIQAISRLGIKFDEWLKLCPREETQPDKAKIMFILPNDIVEAPVVESEQNTSTSKSSNLVMRLFKK